MRGLLDYKWRQTVYNFELTPQILVKQMKELAFVDSATPKEHPSSGKSNERVFHLRKMDLIVDLSATLT